MAHPCLKLAPQCLRSLNYKLTMKKAPLLLVSILLVTASWATDSETVSVPCRVVVQDGELGDIWVGVYSATEAIPTDSMVWTAVEAEEFVLDVPARQELEFVALRRDSLPIIKKWSQGDEASPVTFEFERGSVIKGKVLSTDGFPVARARLTVSSSDEPIFPIPDHASFAWESDEDGNYEIAGFAEGEHEIEVLARSDLPSETFLVRIGENEEHTRDLNLADAYFVTGTVSGPLNRPVSGAQVSVIIPGGVSFPRVELRTVGDETGYFRQGPFQPGRNVYVSAWSETGGSSRMHRVRPPRHDFPLTLSDSIRVYGQLRDWETEKPISEYTLYAHRNSFATMEFTRVSIDGELSETVDEKTMLLHLESPGYPPKFWQVNFAHSNDHDLGTVHLKQGRFISGIVLTAVDGTPVEDARIFWTVYEQLLADGLQDVFVRNGRNPDGLLYGLYVLANRWLANTWTTNSGPDGKFSLGPLPHDRVQLMVIATDHEAQTLDIGESENEVEVALGPRVTFARNNNMTGRVVSTTGEPVPAEVISQNTDPRLNTWTDTDADGNFELAAEPGTNEIYARTDDYGDSNTVSVEVREDTVQHVRFVVYTKGRLTVHLSGLQSGETAILTIEGRVPERNKRYTRDLGNGEHLIQGLRSGKYIVVAETSSGRKTSRWVEVPTDGEARAEIEFSGTNRLYGKVQKREALLDWSFRVIAKPKDPTSASGWGEVSNDGSFEVHGLQDGDYKVTLQWFEQDTVPYIVSDEFDGPTRRGPTLNVVVAGDTQVNIPVSIFAVQGTVHAPGGTERAEVSLIQDGQIVGKAKAYALGLFRISNVEPGEYVVVANQKGFFAEKQELLVNGNVRGVKFQLLPKFEGSLVISGRVAPFPTSGDVWVSLARAENAFHLVNSVQTDDQGRFRFKRLAADDYTLSVLRRGFGDETLSLRKSVYDLVLGPKNERGGEVDTANQGESN